MPLLALRFHCHARTNVGEVLERSASAMCRLGGRAAIDSGSHGGGGGLVGGSTPRFLAFWQESQPRFLAFWQERKESRNARR